MLTDFDDPDVNQHDQPQTDANGTHDAPPAAELEREYGNWDRPSQIDALSTTRPVRPEPTTESAEPTSWVSPGDRLLAKRMDLGEDDLAQFSSRDEFVRAMDLLDRVARRRAPAASAAPAVPPEGAADEPPAEIPPYLTADGKLNLDYYRDPAQDYDPATLAFMEQTHEAIKLVNDMHSQWHEQQAQAAQAEFHDIVDSLDAGFFGQSLVEGRPAEISNEQLARRNELLDQIIKIAPLEIQAADALGAPRPTLAAVAEKVYSMTGRQPAAPAAPASRRSTPAAPPASRSVSVNANQLPAEFEPEDAPALVGANGQPLHGAALRSRQQALLDQSNRRRGAGMRRSDAGLRDSANQQTDATDRTARAMNNPIVRDAFLKLREEQGLS